MSFEEMFGEEERANEFELGTLYAQTTLWLEANTQLFVEPIDNIAGTYEDLPISEHNPRYEIEIPGNVLRSVVPAAAEYFDNEDTLSLLYFIPRYTTMPIDEFDDYAVAKYQYKQPEFSIEIEKVSDPSYGVSITIEDARDEDTWQVKRTVHSNLKVDEEIRENPDGMPFIDAEQYEKGGAISRMTMQEYNLFSAIVCKLDDIKGMMPEPPLYVPEELI